MNPEIAREQTPSPITEQLTPDLACMDSLPRAHWYDALPNGLKTKLAVGATAVVAALGVYKQAPVWAGDRVDYPPITQVIDGVEPQFRDPDGIPNPFAEKMFEEDNCSGIGNSNFPTIIETGKYISSSTGRASVRIGQPGQERCDGYGRGITKLWLETRKPDSKRRLRGDKVTIKSNHMVDKIFRMNTKRSCKPGDKFYVQMLATRSWQGLDGSIKRIGTERRPGHITRFDKPQRVLRCKPTKRPR